MLKRERKRVSSNPPLKECHIQFTAFEILVLPLFDELDL